MRISDKTKLQRGMGTGEGACYKPFITTHEFNSTGTTSVIKDWKTGRQVHCLSQGEALWYYILRWNDNNIDIREQYPLDAEMTNRIALACGIKHPGGRKHIMTTDFLVTEADGTLHAYSVKVSPRLTKRQLEKLCVEKMYWLLKNCKFDMLFKTDVNKVLAANIRIVTEFYDSKRVFDKISAIKHKVAIKEYILDLNHEIITDKLLQQTLMEYSHE